METNTTIITAALALAGLQIGLFAWLKADIGALADRLVMVEREVARVEREVAFMRGRFSLAFPKVTQSKIATGGGSE
ncbi:MAG: hypothetical protein OXI15_15790 [Chromatiales bacterium]|nr:hypothetical protein [Chromatiales bacterium]